MIAHIPERDCPMRAPPSQRPNDSKECNDTCTICRMRACIIHMPTIVPRPKSSILQLDVFQTMQETGNLSERKPSKAIVHRYSISMNTPTVENLQPSKQPSLDNQSPSSFSNKARDHPSTSRESPSLRLSVAGYSSRHPSRGAISGSCR
jgi:hypothetical protein